MKRSSARSAEKAGYRYSYDMLGEGARTLADALRYLEVLQSTRSAPSARRRPGAPHRGAIDLDQALGAASALRSRQRARVRLAELLPRIKVAGGGQGGQHRPDHRCRGGQPPRPLARLIEALALDPAN
jgi:hypothetical protein